MDAVSKNSRMQKGSCFEKDKGGRKWAGRIFRIRLSLAGVELKGTGIKPGIPH